MRKKVKRENYGKESPEDFIEYILNNVTEDDFTGCWNWNLSVTDSGYGQITTLERRQAYIHRIAYWAFVDNNFKVLDNRLEMICHRCDNTKCCNPKHLFKGDGRANMEDMVVKSNGELRDLSIREHHRIISKRSKQRLKLGGEKRKIVRKKFPSPYQLEKVSIEFKF